jgi:hypothetical protein
MTREDLTCTSGAINSYMQVANAKLCTALSGEATMFMLQKWMKTKAWSRIFSKTHVQPRKGTPDGAIPKAWESSL